MPDDLIKQANEGRGTPGRKPGDLLYPNTDHDKVVATEALVEVMRQHQVQQGIIIQQMAETMMKLREDVDQRLDSIERIFNTHCKETDKDCGACKLELESKIYAGEQKNTIKLIDAIDKMDKILKRQDDKLDKHGERSTPKWVTTTFITIVMAIFMVIGGTVWSNSMDIRDHMHGIRTVKEHIKDHEERMEGVHKDLHKKLLPNAQGFNGDSSYTYGVTDGKEAD